VLLLTDGPDVLLPVETVADFFGALVLAGLETAERCGVLEEELRTVPELLLMVELLTFRLLLSEADLAALPVVPWLTAEPELVLADRVTADPLDGFTVELRAEVPDFCLTSEFVLFLLLLTVADFISALFLCVADDLTAERVPALF
jgi:hypothetical protein